MTTKLNTDARLQVFAKWLKDADTSTFCFDSERSGDMERAIVNAQVEVMHKIGDYLEEILLMDDEQLTNNF
jgi:hypothetical protein